MHEVHVMIRIVLTIIDTLIVARPALRQVDESQAPTRGHYQVTGVGCNGTAAIPFEQPPILRSHANRLSLSLYPVSFHQVRLSQCHFVTGSKSNGGIAHQENLGVIFYDSLNDTQREPEVLHDLNNSVQYEHREACS